MAKTLWVSAVLVGLVALTGRTVTTQQALPPGYLDPKPILDAARNAIGADSLRCVTISGTAYNGAVGQQKERQVRHERLGGARRHQHGERIVVHEARDRRAIIDGEVVGQIDAHEGEMSGSMPGAGGFRHEQRPRLGRLERIAAVAELAGHFDVAALRQDRLDFGGARDPQRVFDSFLRT